MKGYIYKIYDNTNGNVYYGSTTQTLSKRIAGHRAMYNKYLNGATNYTTSYSILSNGDYSYCVVEEIECENKWILRNKERFYIENNECVNKQIPTRTDKEYSEKYYEDNKTHIKECSKKYYEDNKEHIRNNFNKEKAKEKIVCECGCSITKIGLKLHKKSTKHTLNMYRLQ